jgi:hypothetical protein
MKASTALGVLLALIAGVTLPGAAALATAVTVGDYYQEGSTRRGINPPSINPSCNNTLLCYAIFNIVPSGKQLLITDVSCELTLTGGGAEQLFRAKLVTMLANGEVSDRGHHLISAWTVLVQAGQPTYHLVANTRQLVKAGERPIIYFHAGGLASFFPDCSITGRVGNPPKE